MLVLLIDVIGFFSAKKLKNANIRKDDCQNALSFLYSIVIKDIYFSAKNLAPFAFVILVIL